MKSRRLPETILPALWLGLIAGFFELAVLGWRKYVGHSFLLLSRDIVWLTPLANALLSLVAVGFLGAAGWCAPRVWTERARLGVSVTILCVSLLSLAGGLSKWSILILGLGIGVQGSRLLVARLGEFHRAVRVTLPLLAVLVLLAGSGGAGLRAWRERRAEAALPPPPGAANVLLIVWDVVRAASVSTLGYERATTPNLSRWAEGGVRFNAAYATTSWTLPSHASVFTGRDAFALSADWHRPLDDRYPTLAELFSRQGYRTGGFVGNVAMASYEGGLPRGFISYEDYRVSLGEFARSLALVRSLEAWSRFSQLTGYYQRLGRRSAPAINARFLRWLDRGSRRPFFAFLNYNDAHDPYLPRPPFDTMFGAVLPRLDPRLGPDTRWTTEGLRAERDSYERAIAGLDADFGALIQALEQRELLDNTLVIVLGDHGEEFGEHGAVSHGHTLYLAAVRVPLVIRFPRRVPDGVAVRGPVSLRDIAPTIQSLVGLRGPRLPGRSLETSWGTSADSAAQAVVSWVSRRPEYVSSNPDSLGNMWAVRWRGWCYVRDRNREELYYLPRDPTESNNLVLSDLGSDVLPRLRGVIDRAAASRRTLGLDGSPKLAGSVDARLR